MHQIKHIPAKTAGINSERALTNAISRYFGEVFSESDIDFSRDNITGVSLLSVLKQSHALLLDLSCILTAGGHRSLFDERGLELDLTGTARLKQFIRDSLLAEKADNVLPQAYQLFCTASLCAADALGNEPPTELTAMPKEGLPERTIESICRFLVDKIPENFSVRGGELVYVPELVPEPPASVPVTVPTETAAQSRLADKLGLLQRVAESNGVDLADMDFSDFQEMFSRIPAKRKPSVGRMAAFRRIAAEHGRPVQSLTDEDFHVMLTHLNSHLTRDDIEADDETYALENPPYKPDVPVTFHGVNHFEKFAPLFDVLMGALDQAVDGKGQERHGHGRPFIEQPIISINTILGSADGLAYQVLKKVQEALQMPDLARQERELYGAINYTAAIIIWLRLNKKA